MTDEFTLIKDHFTQCAQNPVAGVTLGIGDDCALLRPPAQHELAQSIDTLVAGVHFPEQADPFWLGCRALCTSLSDLAAMGAVAHSFTLALTLPHAQPDWLEAFARGLAHIAAEYQVRLIGGDTTCGPLTISLHVQGWLPQGTALRRDTAQVGDYIALSGTLGDAGAALPLALQGHTPDSAHCSAQERWLLTRYYRPTPQLALGQRLRDIGCRCAIDISDGLLADLSHILHASDVGAQIDLAKIPRSSAALSVQYRLSDAVRCGDDYQLCFCLSEDQWQRLQAQHHHTETHIIGRITADKALCDLSGQPLDQAILGYQHFST